MSDNINKSLLAQFYGFNKDSKETKFLSSSKGIKDYESTNSEICSATDQALLSEENGKNQSAEENDEQLNQQQDNDVLPKSPNILTIDELLQKDDNDADSQDSIADIIEEPKEDKDTLKSYPKLEDAFAKAIAKLSESQSIDDGSHTSPSIKLSPDPVVKAKELWREKTMQSREQLLSLPNLLDKCEGKHLDLSNTGIPYFPIEALQHIAGIQMLYLDSNYLTVIPETLFLTLRKLEWLDVRNNQLKEIPTSVKGHPALKTLLLQGNKIERLPLELGLVRNLKNLQTAHNPIVFPPKEILDLDCSKIINFLRDEWNKQHQNEVIELKNINCKIDKKPTTIVCYRKPSRRSSYSSKYKNYDDNSPKTSVRSRSWSYKPSSRCRGGGGGDVVFQQKVMWMNMAKELLIDQANQLQRIIDKRALDKWRWDYRRFSRSNETTNYLLNAPFALHETSSESAIDEKMKDSKLDYNYYQSFEVNFNELVDLFKNLDSARSEKMTPHSKQKKIKAKIDKITEVQRKLENFKFHNNLTDSSYKLPEKTPKKYVRPPSIIL